MQTSHSPQQEPAEPTWQGVPLALEQLRQFFNQIKGALQPPRSDIIDRSAQQGLHVVDLLDQYWQSLPPGSSAAAPRHKRDEQKRPNP